MDPFTIATEAPVLMVATAETIPTSPFLSQIYIDQFLSQQPIHVLEWLHRQSLEEQEVKELLKRKTGVATEEIEEITEYLKPTDQRIFQRISRGGLRGLQVLSLAECRNLSDAGIAKLS